MAIEKISESQQAKALESKANSDAGLAQKVAFIADDASRKTVTAADLAKQAAAKVPDALIAGLQVAIESMLTVINGYQNPKDPTFKPYPLVMKIIKSLSDVIIQLSAMQVQPIPGLAKVNALLATLSIAAKTLDSNNKNSVPGNNPELSPEIMNTIQDLLIATQSLCDVIPLAILKLVFDMFNSVILCFKQIMPHNYGLPIIPPPLITAPICSSMMPNIIDFVMAFNGQVSNATYGVMRKAMKQVQDAQIPLPSPPIVDAQYLPAAPGRDAQATQPSS